MKKFLSFCVVGGIGFFVDSGVYFLMAIIFPVLLSRLLSFSSAVLFTYYFNRSFTFNKQSVMTIAEFSKYYVAMVLGGAVNMGSFLLSMRLVQTIKDYPILGIAIGSVSGLFVNFIFSKLTLEKNIKDDSKFKNQK